MLTPARLSGAGLAALLWLSPLPGLAAGSTLLQATPPVLK